MTRLSIFARHVWAIADAEIRKLRHDPWELLTRAVQPTLWLLVFGEVMGGVRGLPTGGFAYLDFLVPGTSHKAYCSSQSSTASPSSGSATLGSCRSIW